MCKRLLDVPSKHPMEIIEIDVLPIYVCESYVARYEHKYTFPNILMSWCSQITNIKNTK